MKKHLTNNEIKRIFSDPNSLKKTKELWRKEEKESLKKREGK